MTVSAGEKEEIGEWRFLLGERARAPERKELVKRENLEIGRQRYLETETRAPDTTKKHVPLPGILKLQFSWQQ